MNTLLVFLAIAPHFVVAPTLRSEAHRLKFDIGSCAQAGFLKSNVDDGRYAETLAREATLVEPENDLKPPALWHGVGQYDFTNSDVILGAPGKKGWAAQNGLKVRGHVLVYARDDGYTIPRWLLNSEKQISADQAKVMLRDYIHAVAGRYKGKVAMWDVANEAIDDRPNDRPFRLRDSFWFRKLGPEFLVLAFKYAHEADPKAELYYNEYGVENGGDKANAMLALADFLKSKGAPITGLGLQYHTILEEHVRPGDGHYQLLEEIRKRKLTFMITELDLGVEVLPFPRSDPRHGLIAKDQTELTEQASHYADIFRMALGYSNCHGVQMWGITDKHSWIPDYSGNRGAALLFDADYHPKPAYQAVLEVLKAR